MGAGPQQTNYKAWTNQQTREASRGLSTVLDEVVSRLRPLLLLDGPGRGDRSGAFGTRRRGSASRGSGHARLGLH